MAFVFPYHDRAALADDEAADPTAIPSPNLRHYQKKRRGKSARSSTTEGVAGGDEIGDQEVELDFGQKQMLVAVQNDSQWMDERIEEIRERHRKNMQEYRNRKSQESQPHCDPRDSHNRLQTSVTSLPTYLPTYLPTKSVRDIHAPARTHARMWIRAGTDPSKFLTSTFNLNL